MKQINLNDIFITEKLSDRGSKTPNLQAESDALCTLGQRWVEQPQTILKTLVTIAKDLSQAGSAGVSLLETMPTGEEVFRWVALAGALEAYEQETLPRSFSPCNICLERQAPQLYADPARYFTSIQAIEPAIVEGLVIPLMAANQPLGAIWIASHDPQRQFDAEDLRIMTSLANFTVAALSNAQTGQVTEPHPRTTNPSTSNFWQDSTEPEWVEAAVRQREAELSLVTNAVPVLISFIDSQQRYRFTNRMYEEWFGHSATDLYGKTLWEVLGETAYQTIRPYVEQALAGQQVTFESEVLYQDAKTRYISASYIPHLNSQGTVEGFAALVTDISDRKQMESALAQSEVQLRLMIESAKDYAIFTLDMAGSVTRWNSGGQRLLGYQENEILGQNWRIIFTPEDLEQEEADREQQKALQEGRAENERWHVRKDGSRFWASGVIVLLRDEGNQIRGFLKIMQDKTVQRQAGERLNLLYETTSDLLAAKQPLKLMNSVFSKLSVQLELHCYYHFMVEEQENRSLLHLKNYGGISEETARSLEWIEFGQSLCGLVAQERRPIILNQAQIATHPNAQLVCSSGATAYAGYPLMCQGHLLGTLSFISRTRSHFAPEEIDLLHSICEQMAIAIERATLTASIQQQAEQLQQTNRIKDEFLAVLSHELRTPLNPILGWSKLLQRHRLSEAKTLEALAAIERNAKLQAELIEDLLDVSQILQGNLSLNIAPVNLANPIQAAMQTVHLAAEAKSISIQAELDPAARQILGDAARIQQVIWNLLSNAVKFTPTGGRVHLRLEYLDTQAQVIVRDTGKGIASDFLPYVFDCFRQEDGAMTRKFGGLGLGLAIGRYLVELHGGTIQAESQGEGLGATFTVRLPLMPTQPERENQSAASDRSRISTPSSKTSRARGISQDNRVIQGHPYSSYE
jgi:PAS domain S-box-containing protein